MKYILFALIYIGFGFIFPITTHAGYSLLPSWARGDWSCKIDGRPARMKWRTVSSPEGDCVSDGSACICSSTSGLSDRGLFSDSGGSWVPLTFLPNRTRGNVLAIRYLGAEQDDWQLTFSPTANTASGWTTKNKYPLECVKTAKTKNPENILIMARDFQRPLNVALGGPDNMYGEDVLLNGPPYNDRPNGAEYDFNVDFGGTYRLEVKYAAAESRPVQVLINGEMAIANALVDTTGCWTKNCQCPRYQGEVTLREGFNTLRIQRSSVFPHLHSFSLIPLF